MVTSSDNLLARVIDNVFVFTVTRPDLIDPECIRQIGDEINACTKDKERPRVVVDFENVRFLSSSALGMLVALNKVLLERAGGLRVCNVAKDVDGVFRLMRLHELIAIHATIDDALESLAT